MTQVPNEIFQTIQDSTSSPADTVLSGTGIDPTKLHAIRGYTQDMMKGNYDKDNPFNIEAFTKIRGNPNLRDKFSGGHLSILDQIHLPNLKAGDSTGYETGKVDFTKLEAGYGGDYSKILSKLYGEDVEGFTKDFQSLFPSSSWGKDVKGDDIRFGGTSNVSVPIGG